MRVLIADDDRVSTMILGRTLENWGHHVAVARDGTAAWEHLSGPDRPQLAIVDWMMPGLDGLEICRRVRAAEPAPPIYLILLTARTGADDLASALEAGADDYLTKPFDPAQLRVRLHVGARTLGLLARIAHLSGATPAS